MNYKFLVALLIPFIFTIASAFNWDNGTYSYYNFNEPSGTVAIDQRVATNATNYGALVNQSGVLGRCYNFSVNDYVDTNSAIYLGSPFTLNLWVNITGLPGGFQVLASNYNGTATGTCEIFYNDATNTVRWNCGGVTRDVVRNLENNVFHMFTIVSNATNMSLWQNGTIIDMNNPTTTPYSTVWHIGGESGICTGPATCYNATAKIDEFGFWARALSSSEISELWNSGNGLAYNGTYNGTVLADCSTSYSQSKVLNITLNDEGFRTLINGSIDTFFFDTTTDKNYSMDFNTAYYFPVCIHPRNNTLYANATLSYTSNGYTTRVYYLNNATISLPLQTLDLYSISTTNGTGLLFNVEDQNGLEFTDAFIKIERWFPDIYAYKLVSMVVTDDNGEAFDYLDYYDIYYRFKVERNNTVYYTGAKTLISTSPKPIQVSTTVSVPFLEYFQDIAYSTSWAGDVLTVILTDTSNSMLSGALFGYRLTLTGLVQECNSTGTGASMTLICDLTNSTSIVKLNASATFAGGTLLFYTETKDFTSRATTFGGDSFIFTGLIVLSLATMGAFAPLPALILGIVGLVTMYAMGFLWIAWEFVAGIVVVGIITIFVMRK